MALYNFVKLSERNKYLTSVSQAQHSNATWILHETWFIVMKARLQPKNCCIFFGSVVWKKVLGKFEFASPLVYFEMEVVKQEWKFVMVVCLRSFYKICRQGESVALFRLVSIAESLVLSLDFLCFLGFWCRQIFTSGYCLQCWCWLYKSGWNQGRYSPLLVSPLALLIIGTANCWHEGFQSLRLYRLLFCPRTRNTFVWYMQPAPLRE